MTFKTPPTFITPALGRTRYLSGEVVLIVVYYGLVFLIAQLTPWRNGSASDSRSEGCVFKSRRGQQMDIFKFPLHLQSKAAIG